jgi:hypothetical protein
MPTNVNACSGSLHLGFKFLIKPAVFIVLMTDQKISHHRWWRSTGSL